MDTCYEIRIRGHLSPDWAAVFEGMKICCLEDGDTSLTGPLPDPSALYGLLLHLRDLGLTLVSVNPVDIH